MFHKIRRSFRKKKVFYCVSCGRIHKENANCDYENVSMFDYIPSQGSASTAIHSRGLNESLKSASQCYHEAGEGRNNLNYYTVPEKQPFWMAKHIEDATRQYLNDLKNFDQLHLHADSSSSTTPTSNAGHRPPPKLPPPPPPNAAVPATSQDALNGNHPPALPPRSQASAPLVPAPPRQQSQPQPQQQQQQQPQELPPPPPPRVSAHMPPPATPPRGTTPPPPPPQSSVQSLGPSILRRISPVPSLGPRPGRGTSPIGSGVIVNGAAAGAAAPMRVQNSREIQQQFQQTLQTLSFFDSGTEPPPPPYRMDSGASAAAGSAPATNPLPPPTYSQSLAMRGSPTLSSTSSDIRTVASGGVAASEFRRSPGPGAGIYPVMHLAPAVTPTSPVPSQAAAAAAAAAAAYMAASPSPASSMMSASSRTSSMQMPQSWSARQTKTQSPVIMQSVKSMQVQKPVLQTATEPAAMSVAVEPAAAASKLPPPSYEVSIQSKQQGRPSPCPPPPPMPMPMPMPVPMQQGSSNPSPCPDQQRFPPPPPYPSSAVTAARQGAGSGKTDDPNGHSVAGLVNGTPTPGSQPVPVISTAKVVAARGKVDASKPPLQRKYSPMTVAGASASEAGSSAAASRSESPVSEYPVSLSSESTTTTTGPNTGDSDVAMDRATTHLTSPKPERKHLAGAEEENRKPSIIRKLPSHAYKFFMEQHIENVIKEYEQRQARQRRLEQELVQAEQVYKEWNEMASCQLRLFLRQKETNYLRMKRAKLKRQDFHKIKKIGSGAYGEVFLVRCNNNGGRSSLYAMKTLKKTKVVLQRQVAHVIAERDILSEADNDWIVKLYFSFQDKHNLYFILEYIPGGDLMNLLIKKDIFDEAMARFYTAELICAVESVHAMGFIHRDIKPDNILIDLNGHIKLTDFGLCTGFRWTHNTECYNYNRADVGHYRQDSMDPGQLDLEAGRCSCPAYEYQDNKILNRRKLKQMQRSMAHSLVGTPNYIAPEVLMQRPYNQSCDWWSVGVILYEMINGRPPFHATTPRETQNKIIHWKENLNFKDSESSRRDPNYTPYISLEAENLIKELITDPETRLGRTNGSTEIKAHPFFHNFDFNVRERPAPYQPRVMHDTDTSNFDSQDNAQDIDIDHEPEEEHMAGGRKDYNHSFYEFTFRRFFTDSGHPMRLPEPKSDASQQQHDPQAPGNHGEGSAAGSKASSSQNSAPGPVYV